MALRCLSSSIFRYRLVDQRVPAMCLTWPRPGEGRVAVGEGADHAGSPADLAHDALERIVGPDTPPALLWRRVVRQGLGPRRLDPLGRLAEPHVSQSPDNLRRVALGGWQVLLSMDGLEHQRHLAQLAGGDMAEDVAVEMHHATLPARLGKELGSALVELFGSSQERQAMLVSCRCRLSNPWARTQAALPMFASS